MSHFLFYPNSEEYFDKRNANSDWPPPEHFASIQFQAVIEKYGFFPPYEGTTPNQHPFVSYRATQSKMVHGTVE